MISCQPDANTERQGCNEIFNILLLSVISFLFFCLPSLSLHKIGKPVSYLYLSNVAQTEGHKQPQSPTHANLTAKNETSESRLSENTKRSLFKWLKS